VAAATLAFQRPNNREKRLIVQGPSLGLRARLGDRPSDPLRKVTLRDLAPKVFTIEDASSLATRLGYKVGSLQQRADVADRSVTFWAWVARQHEQQREIMRLESAGEYAILAR
jgi:hypothetical protein